MWTESIVNNQADLMQTITQAVVETLKAAVQAMAVDVSESSLVIRSEPVSTGLKLGRPLLRKTTFDQGAIDKYVELKTSG